MYPKDFPAIETKIDGQGIQPHDIAIQPGVAASGKYDKWGANSQGLKPKAAAPPLDSKSSCHSIAKVRLYFEPFCFFVGAVI